MKSKSMKKSTLLVLSLAIILMVAVGGTIAWLVAESNEVVNTFKPASVSCEVAETLEGDIKKEVWVKNTSDIDAYIRATVVVNWVDGSGNVYGTPVSSDDYKITLNVGADKDWFKGSDGFYYYRASVASEHETTVLFTNCKEVTGNAPVGYHLQVTILAEAIQAAGVDGSTPAVEKAWPAVKVSGGVLELASTGN